MLCRKHSICHFERAEGESRNLLCVQISPLRVHKGRFGRNDRESFLQSKLKTQNFGDAYGC